jgi:hypothetical protein
MIREMYVALRQAGARQSVAGADSSPESICTAR